MGVAFGQMSALLRRKASGHVSRVFEVTASRTVKTGESGSVFTNLGASGTIVFSLPASAKKGTYYTFFVATAQAVQIEPGASNGIYYSTAKNGDGLYLQLSGIGSSVTLVADSNHDWIALSPIGTLAAES